MREQLWLNCSNFLPIISYFGGVPNIAGTAQQKEENRLSVVGGGILYLPFCVPHCQRGGRLLSGL